MGSTREPQIVWVCSYCREQVNRKEKPDDWRFGTGQTMRGCPCNDYDKHDWHKK